MKNLRYGGVGRFRRGGEGPVLLGGGHQIAEAEPSFLAECDLAASGWLSIIGTAPGGPLAEPAWMIYVTDMRHFAGMDELVGPQFAPAKRFAAYLGGVVSAATVHPPGEVIATGLACHRRPGHKPCSGWLLVRRAEAAARIEWACPVCSDEGVISGWEGSPWDLSPALSTNDERAALLSIDQYRRLLGLRLLDTDSLRVVYAARRTGVGVMVSASEEDLENLIGYVADETDRGRRRGLDDVIRILDAALVARE
jgi:hypothetical protein